MEFEEKFRLALGAIADHTTIPQKLADTAIGQYEIEIVGGIGLLGHVKLVR